MIELLPFARSFSAMFGRNQISINYDLVHFGFARFEGEFTRREFRITISQFIEKLNWKELLFSFVTQQ